MSRVRGGLGVALALATIAAFSIPARAAVPPDVSLPLAAAPGVSHRAVCTPGPAGTARCHAHVVTGADGVSPRATQSYSAGYSPAQLRGAYGLSGSPTPTVAIVDAYDEPNAESDLNAYRSQFGLGSCTTANGCFKKVSQSGSTPSLPSANIGWGQEIALDIEMVSAICPSCKILLVEANSNYYSDLTTAVSYAKAQGAI